MSKHRRRQQREPAQPDRADDATLMRVVNDFVGYWKICGAAECKRRRGCAGDATACHDRFWRWTPERIKVYFRAALAAINAGAASEQEVRRAAEAEVESAAEHIAYTEAVQARAWDAHVAQRAERASLPAGSSGPRHALPTDGERRDKAGPRVRAL